MKCRGRGGREQARWDKCWNFLFAVCIRCMLEPLCHPLQRVTGVRCMYLLYVISRCRYVCMLEPLYLPPLTYTPEVYMYVGAALPPLTKSDRRC